MAKQRTWYMHTLDGKPACFDPVQRQVYIASYRHRATLVRSLPQIRREQRIDREWFIENAPQHHDYDRYGYVLVRLPDDA